MARLQRKQHLDSLEIHSVRDDVLANEPQLFSLHLLVMQLRAVPLLSRVLLSSSEGSQISGTSAAALFLLFGTSLTSP